VDEFLRSRERSSGQCRERLSELLVELGMNDVEFVSGAMGEELQQQFAGPQARLRIFVAEHAADNEQCFAAGFFIPLGAGGLVEFVPGCRVARGPALTGLGRAVQILGDLLPGVPARAKFSGLCEKSFHVEGHEWRPPGSEVNQK